MLLSTVFSALLNRRAILAILGARQLLIGKLVEPAGGLNGKVGTPRGPNLERLGPASKRVTSCFSDLNVRAVVTRATPPPTTAILLENKDTCCGISETVVGSVRVLNMMIVCPNRNSRMIKKREKHVGKKTSHVVGCETEVDRQVRVFRARIIGT
jgi:hypothetical protein